ncbi:MAG: PDZ domain-containing protein [Saprospiraceae bacterium]
MKNLILFGALFLSFNFLFAQVNNNNSAEPKKEIRKKIYIITNDSIDSKELGQDEELELLTNENEEQLEEIIEKVEKNGGSDKTIRKKIIIVKNEKPEGIDLKGNKGEKVIINELEDFPHFNKDLNENKNDIQNRAILGVNVLDALGNNGVNISKVLKNSGAEAAGLQEGDLIMSVNKHKITNINELLDQLSNFSPGDKVKLRVLRNGIVMKKTIELSSRIEVTQFKSCCYKGQKECTKNSIDIEEEQKEAKKLTELKKFKKFNFDKQVETNDQESETNLNVSVISASPNPNQGKMTIKYSGDKAPFEVKVIDLNGKELFKDSINDESGEYNKEVVIDKAIGTVIVHVNQGKKHSTAKIIMN